MESSVQLKRIAIPVLTAGYAAALIVISLHHEVWRDEVRALSIAGSAGSFLDLFSKIHNEGHPALWYLVLRGAGTIFSSALVLQAASVLIAVAAAVVFVTRAPFPLWIKALWLFSYYPLYEYSVVSRNYGLGMLLLFIYCAGFNRRFAAPLATGLLLAALANTSLYGLLLAGSLVCSLVCEAALTGQTPASRKKLATGFVIAVAGIIFSLVQMYPDSSSVVTPVTRLSIDEILLTLAPAFLSHGSIAHNAFGLPWAWTVYLIAACLYLHLIRKPAMIVFVLTFIVAFELSHRTVYSAAALRHQGFLVLTVIASLWMEQHIPVIAKASPALIRLRRFTERLAPAGLALLLLPQIYAGVKAIKNDLQHLLSSAPHLASVVNSSPALGRAIIASEPDYVLETLPYYLDNQLYFAREERFGRFVKFAGDVPLRFTLSELLDRTRRVSAEECRPAMLLLPPDVEKGGELKMLYGRSFVYEEPAISELLKQTTFVARLDKAVSDENYSVYVLQTPCEGGRPESDLSAPSRP